MKEKQDGNPSQRERIDRLTKALARDLAELAQAQAKLMADLVELLDKLPESDGQLPLQDEAESADMRYRGEPEQTPVQSQQESEPVAETEAEPEVAEEEADTGLSQPAEAPVEVPVVEPIPEPAGDMPEVAADLEVDGPTDDHVAQIEEIEPAAEEIGDEDEETEDPSDTVLVLESQDARVGVLWDQVVQIGSLTTPTVPERIDTDHGPVDLISLGSLLEGDSREEKYFVVLGQKGEKAAVACERMLGLGPLASAAKNEQDSRIQVLQVDLLRTFAKSAQTVPESGESKAESAAVTKEEEERDRNGPLRALVAVRYLPARVAICRYLRGRGWQVGEAAGLEAAIVSLDLGRWDALFLEARSNGQPDEAEEALLNRVGELSIPVIRVGSRVSGYPTQGGPSLMFPFSEAELDSILSKAGGKAGS